MAKTTTLKFREVLREVMTVAHRNYSHKYNTRSWAECLANAWFAMKLKIRRGFVKVEKVVKPAVRKAVKRANPVEDIFRGCDPQEVAWAMGYGRGPGFYCGD